MELKEGWLQRTMDDAGIRIMAGDSLSTAMHNMCNIKWIVPIAPDEAKKLYAVLNARFKSWTGCDLKNFDN